MSAPFIYLQSDRTKTPVDLNAQPQGTELVQVTSGGRELPFTVGKTFTNTAEEVRARFARARSRPNSEG